MANTKKPDAKKLQATREIITAKKQEIALRPDDTRPQYERTLDEMAPSWTDNRVIKFVHDEGAFRTQDDNAEVSPDAEFAALCGETMIGWVRFNGKGELPDRIMGKVYDNFVLPNRDDLGDTDRSTWKVDPWGNQEDPFKIHQYLVLQRVDTSEFFTFAAQNATGCFAVSRLCKHYNRACKDHGEVPIVHLRVGTHKQRPVPVFVVCGQQKLDPNAPSSPPADPVPSVSGELDDEIKF